jgi:hypothetical protein
MKRNLKSKILLLLSFILVLNLVIIRIPIVNAINTVPSDYRQRAYNYASQYWNKISDDSKYIVWLGQNSKFTSFITGYCQIQQEWRINRSYTREFRNCAYDSLKPSVRNILADNNVTRRDFIDNSLISPPVELPSNWSYTGTNEFSYADDIIWDDILDCAHFISCCIGINGGGIPIPFEAQYSGTYGFTSALKLSQWIINNNYSQVYYDYSFPSYGQQPEIGDVIIWQNSEGIYHSTIIISNNGGLACHTDERFNSITYRDMLSDGWEARYFFHFVPEDSNQQPPNEDSDKPDLVVKQYSLDRTTFSEGEYINLDIEIKNDGKSLANSSYVRIYLSPENDWYTSDDYYVSEEYVPSLNKNDFFIVHREFEFPDMKDTYNGKYQVWLIFVIDVYNQVDETVVGENNIFKSNNSLTVYES